MNITDPDHRKAIIGSPQTNSFWLYDSTSGFDLTHPPSPTIPSPDPSLTLKTTTVPITISIPKTALVIIDMQNFFLSPLLGRPTSSKGLQAQAQLLKHAIPAARKAGIRIIWLNWGLTEDELRNMPPATLRAFGFETVLADQFANWGHVGAKQAAIDSHGVNEGCDKFSSNSSSSSSTSPTSSSSPPPDAKIETPSNKNPRIYKGLGTDIGDVTDDDGTVIHAGRLLMRDSWNADVTPELRAAYEEGLKSDVPDVWIHKNRMSGLWGVSTECTEYLDSQGIRTLLFAGVNTDQCVGGSLQDAFSKGYDVILLSDGCGTTSPATSQESIEFNCAKTWGFCTTCKDFANGAGL